MKNLKFLMPVLAFVMAVGLAFATPEIQENGWISVDGIPTQLDEDPCTGDQYNCRVIFLDDNQQRVFTVYTDNTLQTPKKSSSFDPLILPEMPEVE